MGGWIGIAVLLANVVATLIVAWLYRHPLNCRGPLCELTIYTYVVSLGTSICGGLALAIRQQNPWWLITVAWAMAHCAMLLILVRAIARAFVH